MIIDTHAHALDEAFLQGLCRTPRFGLSADRDTAGRFCVRRGDGAPVSLDDELSNIPGASRASGAAMSACSSSGRPRALRPGPAAPPTSNARARSTSMVRGSLPRGRAAWSSWSRWRSENPSAAPMSSSARLTFMAPARPCCRQRPQDGRSIPAHSMTCLSSRSDAGYCCSCIRFRQSRHRAFRSTHCNSSCNGRPRLHSPLLA